MKTIISAELDRAAKKAVANQSFIMRNYWLWIVVAYIVYPIAAVWSALTAGGNIFLRLKTAAGDGWYVFALAFAIAVMIEVIKFFTGKGAIDDMQAKAWNEGGPARFGFLIKVFGFIAIMIFSINLSISGAKLANEYFRYNFQPVTARGEYIPVDAIQARYANELARHQSNIDQYKTIRWKGTITVAAQRMIAKEQKAMDRVLAARDREVGEATGKNAATESAHNAQTETNGNFRSRLAGVGEIIVIFCLVFIGIYDDGLQREYREKSGKSSPGIGFQRSAPTPAFAMNETPEKVSSVAAPDPIVAELQRQIVALQSRLEQGQQTRQQNQQKPRESVATRQQISKNVAHDYDRLRRKVKEYKARQRRGELGNKGEATLHRLMVELDKMKQA